MREIKLRAWSRAFNQIISWEELKFDKDENDNEICFYEQEDGSDGHWLGGAEYEIMQYTGLKDENGQEIYEGDILDYQGYVVVVEWNDISGKWESNLPHENILAKLQGHGFSRATKIGNIYENKDLID